MARTAHHAARPWAMTELPAVPRPGARGWGLGLAAVFLLLLVDALLHPRAFFDLWAMHGIQGVELPGLRPVLVLVNRLTGSTGAVAAWALLVVGFVIARRWLPALAVATLPVGGVVNLVVGEALVARTRPHLAELARTSRNFEERSFPSGHVLGAVTLYGLVFVLAAAIPRRGPRLLVRTACVGVIAGVGFARVWTGAHWPTDVAAAYALGGAMVAALVAVYRRLDVAVGSLPFVGAAALPHDEAVPHAHALTSLVVFDRPAGTVTKVYAPGFVPRAIYWLAFQAPFPYAGNADALRTATHRRNVAALLTRAWYGEERVARALGVAPVAAAGGRLGLTSALVVGRAPADRAAARAFLRDLRDRFDVAGLPTWQIDPRQPRAIDNVLETADGAYHVVDLESGLVAPLASRLAWRRAIRRNLVPFYDEVFFDVTRAHVEREVGALTAALGADGLNELRAELDACERASAAWQATEPRLWGRLLAGTRSGFGVRTWPAGAGARLADGQRRGMAWLEGAIAAWQAEGRIDAAQAAGLRAQIAAPGFQAMLPYLGAHVAVSVPLRFPFGSVARAAMVAGALGVETGRFLLGRSDRAALRRAWGLHSPLVAVLAAVPGFGSFAYLAARPVRADRLLVRLLADGSLRKTPWSLYARTGAQRFVAPPATRPLPSAVDHGRATAMVPKCAVVTSRPRPATARSSDPVYGHRVGLSGWMVIAGTASLGGRVRSGVGQVGPLAAASRTPPIWVAIRPARTADRTIQPNRTTCQATTCQASRMPASWSEPPDPLPDGGRPPPVRLRGRPAGAVGTVRRGRGGGA